MGNFKIKDLREYLKEKEADELRDEIVELVKEFKEVKSYYNLKLNPESEQDELIKHKKKISDEFFPSRGFGKLRYKIIDDAIKDFTKISLSVDNIIDLILTFIENATMFIDEYGDIKETFYEKIYDSYEKAIDMIVDNELRGKFEERMKWIYKNTTDGYGFENEIGTLYYERYGGED